MTARPPASSALVRPFTIAIADSDEIDDLNDDPDLAEKIAALQARNFREHPEVAAVVAQAASFTVPDGSGSAT